MSNLIERKNTADAMERWLYDGKDNRTVREVVYELPSAQPERKTGEWTFLEPNGFKCSECNRYLNIACGDVKMNFCPNCGADMRGERDEAE